MIAFVRDLQALAKERQRRVVAPLQAFEPAEADLGMADEARVVRLFQVGQTLLVRSAGGVNLAAVACSVRQVDKRFADADVVAHLAMAFERVAEQRLCAVEVALAAGRLAQIHHGQSHEQLIARVNRSFPFLFQPMPGLRQISLHHGQAGQVVERGGIALAFGDFIGFQP